jgi:hypothetical protein
VLSDLAPLAQVGAVGVILAFVLIQISPRLERIERAIDMNSRAILLDIVSRDGSSDLIRAQASSMLKTIESRHTKPDTNGGL